MNKELLNKLAKEGDLTISEQAELDRALDAQEHARHAIRALPVDEPSMTWRSRLNGRVIELGRAVERRRRSLLIWRPALGLGLAASLAVLLTLDRGTDTAPFVTSRTPVEAALIQEHSEA